MDMILEKLHQTEHLDDTLLHESGKEAYNALWERMREFPEVEALYIMERPTMDMDFRVLVEGNFQQIERDFAVSGILTELFGKVITYSLNRILNGDSINSDQFKQEIENDELFVLYSKT